MSFDTVSFDDLENTANGAPKKPFFAINYNSDADLLLWLKEEFTFLANDSNERLEKVKNNMMRYKGIQYLNQVYQPRDVLVTQKKFSPQMVAPLISDAVDEKVARLMEFKPIVAVVPEHDETENKTDSKMAKAFLSSVNYTQKLDQKFRQSVKSSKIAGESFIWTRWNPEIGDKVPGTNQPQGDIECVNKATQHVLYELADNWEQVCYAFIVEFEYTEALKRDFPDKAGDITEDMGLQVYDFAKLEERALRGKTRKITFYHKKTKYLPEGFEAVFVNNVILKKGPLPYAHGELPIDRLIDEQNEGELHGDSFIEKTRTMASGFNNLLNSIMKQVMLAGWAKWFVEQGSIEDQQLNNDVNIVKIVPGAKAPVLAQANPVGPGLIGIMDKLSDMFYKFAKSNSVVQGDLPEGVTAFVALQFVSESESRRLSTDVANLNAFVRVVNDKILKTASQFYEDDDERLIAILGKDMRYEKLDIQSLRKSYKIEIQNTSGLSDSKSLRTQQVVDLSERFPDMIPREQVLEMTGLAQADKFIDIGSSAAKAAEDENEQMLDGKPLIQPFEAEDLTTHWTIHAQALQPLGIRQNAPPEVLQNLKDHLMATELLMFERLMVSPPFANLVATKCPQFPMLMKPPAPPPLPDVPPPGPAPHKVENPKKVEGPPPIQPQQQLGNY